MDETTREFRFGVVGAPRTADEWLATARRSAELGYTTLLMPDGLQLPAPMPALAMAAAIAPIRVGTWVLAVPLRPVRTTAWEAHSLTTLTGGRFELGLGTGRPIVADWAREIGLPYGTPAERLAGVGAVIDAVRALDGDGPRTPVLIAAGGPRARALAAQRADIVTFAVGALTSRDDVAAMVRDLRAGAGERDIEIATNLFVVGDQFEPGAERYIGADLAGLRAVDSLALLEGSARTMADELQRRRDRFGMSYVTVNGVYLEALAPVVELLAGN